MTRIIGCIALMIFSQLAAADCFYDQFGNSTCIQKAPPIDYSSGDTHMNVYRNGQLTNPSSYQQYTPMPIRPEVPYTPATANDPYRGLNLR